MKIYVRLKYEFNFICSVHIIQIYWKDNWIGRFERHSAFNTQVNFPFLDSLTIIIQLQFDSNRSRPKECAFIQNSHNLAATKSRETWFGAEIPIAHSSNDSKLKSIGNCQHPFIAILSVERSSMKTSMSWWSNRFALPIMELGYLLLHTAARIVAGDEEAINVCNTMEWKRVLIEYIIGGRCHWPRAE